MSTYKYPIEIALIINDWPDILADEAIPMKAPIAIPNGIVRPFNWVDSQSWLLGCRSWSDLTEITIVYGLQLREIKTWINYPENHGSKEFSNKFF